MGVQGILDHNNVISQWAEPALELMTIENAINPKKPDLKLKYAWKWFVIYFCLDTYLPFCLSNLSFLLETKRRGSHSKGEFR